MTYLITDIQEIVPIIGEYYEQNEDNQKTKNNGRLEFRESSEHSPAY